ncbi:MAG: CoA pyrophosphatase [Oscillospiraceae bacterium]|nr:CoA pyrophosphatase [Oscillospiraceae bacterium]
MELNHLNEALSRRTPGIMDAEQQYAVLVPLVNRPDGLHLLYEVRAAALHRQPGEVCFPGGHMESGETPADCALRETCEELNIPPRSIEVLGPLDIICGRGNFVMYPILALMDGQTVDTCRPSPEEVDHIFTVPLSALAGITPGEYCYDLVPHVAEDFPYAMLGITPDYPWRSGRESGPVYPWQDKAIWGLTGRVTRHVLQLLKKEGVV